MRPFLVVLALLALPALAAEPRAARSRAASHPAATAPAPSSPAPEEMGMVGGTESEGVDGAGALGMLTALAASFVFARGRRSGEKTPRR